uniref:Uncharacterized protein n=1 Tax=Leersia perrieri TaxID=77586 RepID=A0A0D9VAR5_9ORYZ
MKKYRQKNREPDYNGIDNDDFVFFTCGGYTHENEIKGKLMRARPPDFDEVIQVKHPRLVYELSTMMKAEEALFKGITRFHNLPVQNSNPRARISVKLISEAAVGIVASNRFVMGLLSYCVEMQDQGLDMASDNKLIAL